MNGRIEAPPEWSDHPMAMQSASTAADPARAPARHHVLGWSQDGFHRMSYTEWGDPHAGRVVVCVHGLTRNARDFDVLAQALAAHCRVLCPDIAGRGESDWLTRKESYCYPQYLADMTALLARATEHLPPGGRIDWVGTSMGGLLGILAASQPKHPIGRLVLNDIGPFVPRAAQERIARYLGQPVHFRNLDDAVQYVRTVSAPFGPLTDAQWRHLAVHSVRRDADGQWTFRYDPAIAHAFAAPPIADASLWEFWDRIDCPVLVLRGEQSDVLLAQTADEMTRRGPRARLIEFAGIGHAPSLLSADQVMPICAFLGVKPQATADGR
jgi:pimeloyl-ACP methyl ester carboxylesterase